MIARATLPHSSRGAVRHRPEGGSERRARPGRAGVPHLAERGLEGLVWGVSRRLAWGFWAGRRDVWDGVSGLVWDAPCEGFRTASGGVSRRDATGCGVGSASRVAGVGFATKMGHFVEKSMYQKRYKNGRLAAVFDAIFV